MGYTLCVLGQILASIFLFFSWDVVHYHHDRHAVLSGVNDSLVNYPSTFRDSDGFPELKSHTPGTLTPVQSLEDPDNSIASRFFEP